MGTIVVGVDGSPESKAALAWALEEARLRDATLHVVYAWELAVFVDLRVGYPQDIEAFREDARIVLDETLSAVLGSEDPGVEIEKEVVEESPVRALLRAAESADLLVVGSRGRGGFMGLLLGSVSQQVSHHAPGPVVIVRGTDD